MYLDPGIGSLVIQVVMGLALSIPVLITAYWRRLRSYFHGRLHRGN